MWVGRRAYRSPRTPWEYSDVPNGTLLLSSISDCLSIHRVVLTSTSLSFSIFRSWVLKSTFLLFCRKSQNEALRQPSVWSGNFPHFPKPLVVFRRRCINISGLEVCCYDFRVQNLKSSMFGRERKAWYPSACDGQFGMVERDGPMGWRRRHRSCKLVAPNGTA